MVFPKEVVPGSRCSPRKQYLDRIGAIRIGGYWYRHVNKMAPLRDRQCRNGVYRNERGRGSGVSAATILIGPRGQTVRISGPDFAISRWYIRRWRRFSLIRAIKC